VVFVLEKTRPFRSLKTVALRIAECATQQELRPSRVKTKEKRRTALGNCLLPLGSRKTRPCRKTSKTVAPNFRTLADSIQLPLFSLD